MILQRVSQLRPRLRVVRTDNLLQIFKLKMTSKPTTTRPTGRGSANTLAAALGSVGSKRSSTRSGTRLSKQDGSRGTVRPGSANDTEEVLSPPQAKPRTSVDPAVTLDPAKRGTPPDVRFEKMAEKASSQTKIPDQPGPRPSPVLTPTGTTNGNPGSLVDMTKEAEAEDASVLSPVKPKVIFADGDEAANPLNVSLPPSPAKSVMSFNMPDVNSTDTEEVLAQEVWTADQQKIKAFGLTYGSDPSAYLPVDDCKANIAALKEQLLGLERTLDQQSDLSPGGEVAREETINATQRKLDAAELTYRAYLNEYRALTCFTVLSEETLGVANLILRVVGADPCKAATAGKKCKHLRSCLRCLVLERSECVRARFASDSANADSSSRRERCRAERQPTMGGVPPSGGSGSGSGSSSGAEQR